MELSRRHFMLSVGGVALLLDGAVAATEERDSLMPTSEGVSGAIVICNHWTQYGIGETFPEGEIRGRWYRRNFSTVFGIEQGRHWVEADPRNRVCHEFDAYFLDALAAEDPGYLGVIRDLLDHRLMELPGGTFGQPESQVFGYESALRQLTFGQAAYRRHLGRGVDTFIVEEQDFYPQLPQILKLAGYKYASIQFQNSGTPDPLPDDLILWEAMDGTTIPTIPNHPGMQSCARQNKPYDEADGASVVAQLAGRKAPLIFQWMELWPPGLDWGASIAPYAQAIHALEGKGYRQMLLTEYVQWALGRCEPRRVRIPLDKSNYNNNFFQGGWGYENEKTARGSNQCESLLMAAETLFAGGHKLPIEERLPDLWSRLLVSQNHDPYLAGSIPAYVDGARSFMSELAVKQLTIVRRALRDEASLDAPVSPGKSFRLFNPCPWEVATPVLFELNDATWPDYALLLDGERELAAVFRADSGNILVGPAMVRMAPYDTCDLRLDTVSTPPTPKPAMEGERLRAKNDGHQWEVAQDLFSGIQFEPLLGTWKQVPSYFDSMHPNRNVEKAYSRIEDGPVDISWRKKSDGMEMAAWREELMRIRDVAEPALCVQGLVFAGRSGILPLSAAKAKRQDAASTPFVQFNHRLTSTIRFETGSRPLGTWRFRLAAPTAGLRVFADAPFSEEERCKDTFYCARYVRLEWPDRHILWCPSQNTLFRRVEEGSNVYIECIVLDFSFTGAAHWDMRFHAATSFSAAESMRLAETFHRKPIRVPSGATAGRVAGIAVDNPNVLITHLFPAGRRAFAVRTLNASHDEQKAVITCPHDFASVTAADLDGNGQEAATSYRLSHGSRRQCHYVFRPWEIATFRVKQA